MKSVIKHAMIKETGAAIRGWCCNLVQDRQIRQEHRRALAQLVVRAARRMCNRGVSDCVLTWHVHLCAYRKSVHQRIESEIKSVSECVLTWHENCYNSLSDASKQKAAESRAQARAGGKKELDRPLRPRRTTRRRGSGGI